MLLIEGITPFLTLDIIKRCKDTGIRTVLDFVSLDTEALSKKISTSYKDVSSIQRILLARYASFPQTGDNLYDDQLQTLSILNTGCKRLDEFLEGGIYTGEITEIHGLPGSGKTQLCLSILSCLLLETDNTALYLDTNGSFTSKRLAQILFAKSKDKQVVTSCLRKVRIFIIHDMYQLFDVVHRIKNQLCKQEDMFYSCLKLIVLDSATPIIAPWLGGLQFDGHGLMTALALELKLLCSDHAVSIIVCNNMVQGENSCDKPALGRTWKHVPSVALCISKVDETFVKSSRILSIQKSCRNGIFGSVTLNVFDEGVSSVPRN